MLPLKGQPFTKENAAEMARRSQAAQKQRRAHEDMLALAAARTVSAAGKSNGNPDNHEQDTYVSGRLATVRAQLARLDAQMLEVRDPDAAGKLATAIARLTDVEFALANRPKPANVKPEAARPRRLRLEVPGADVQ
jgi:hypothetical protein